MKPAIAIMVALMAGCTSAPPLSLPDGRNRVVDIVNTANRPLQFEAVNAERKGLRRPAPISATVAAQYYLTINFDDGTGACRFDFIGRFADGTVAKSAGFDTCHEVSWVVSP